MLSRYTSFIVAAALVFSAGCQRSGPADPPQAAATGESQSAARVRENPDTIARLCWAGKQRVAADTNSHDLMRMWDLPASATLEAQVLDRLATAPWRLLHRAADTNASRRLRPLLGDVLREPSYLEVRAVSNQFWTAAFAIKLKGPQADLWEANLAAVLESLAGIQPVAAGGARGWSLRKHHPPELIELTRAGDWTIVTAGLDRGPLIGEFVQRIKAARNPFVSSPGSNWLQADFDLARLARVLAVGGSASSNMPAVALTVTGDGLYVRTRAELNFPHALALNLESWNIPTNLIQGELDSFTAVRGFSNWLESLPAWNRLQIGPPPNQVVLWGLPKFPAQIYFAAPLPDASNRVAQIADPFVNKANALLGYSELAGFATQTRFNGVLWTGVPYLFPFFMSVKEDQGDYIFGGTTLVEGKMYPADAQFFRPLDQTNLVYHDREFTGGQIEEWLYVGQYARSALHRPQLPAESASVKWLLAIMPLVGSSATDLKLTGPAQLTFTRTAGIGLTALELHLLVDWLESPDFPLGTFDFPVSPRAQPAGP